MLNCLKFFSILLNYIFEKFWRIFKNLVQIFNKIFKIFQKFLMSPFCWMSPLPEPKFLRRYCSTRLEWNSCMKFCPRFPPPRTKILEPLLLFMYTWISSMLEVAKQLYFSAPPSPARSSFSWHGTARNTIFNFRPVWARENLFSSMF